MTMERFEYADETVPVTPEDVERLAAHVRAEHDRQAAVGDVPAPPEVDDTETAPR